MKSLLIILTVILSTTMTQASHGGHGNSMGSGPAVNHHSFELSQSVIISLTNRYHHFDLIHTRRTHQRGGLSFDLVIQHGSSYARVTIDNTGRFYRETYYPYYPLENHYCDEFCSFQYRHYQNGGFASYDPYSGCKVHLDLIISRHPRYIYQPYYGYGSIHYHSGHGLYKRFRNRDHHGDYYMHRKPQKYHGHEHRKHQGHHERYLGPVKRNGHHGGNHKVHNGRKQDSGYRHEKKFGRDKKHHHDQWEHEKEHRHKDHRRRG